MKVMYLVTFLCILVRTSHMQRCITGIMYFFRQISMLATIAATIKAQDAPVAPTMSLIYHMEADLGEPFNLGPVPTGQQRTVIPIVGGFFKGERLSGTRSFFTGLRGHINFPIGKVLNLGADWLLVDTRGVSRPDTRYNIQTDDGAYIYVQTEGPQLKDGRILLRGKFETSTNGTYAWMNDVIAVGVLNVADEGKKVLIDMWEVVP